MSINPGYIGTGAYAINAHSLMQTNTSKPRSSTQSAESATTTAEATSPSSVTTISHNYQQARSCMHEIAQCHKAGVDIQQVSQSLYGNTYSSGSDFLQAVADTSNEVLSSSSINTQA
jgi:hypothetical protein